MRLALVALVLGVWALTAPAGAFAAEPCPNEARRAEDPYSAALPDCRAYEQVSPVEKNLGSVVGWFASVRVAPSGEAVTFNSLTSFPGSEGQVPFYGTYVAMRGAQGWSSRNMEGISAPASDTPVAVGVSEDLRQVIVASTNTPPLSPEGVEGVQSLYLRESATGAYRQLASGFLGLEKSFGLVAAADGGSRIFFESSHRLLAEAPLEKEGFYNLYEWHEGQLSLVDVLPEAEGGGAPPGGASAGLYAPPAANQAGYAVSQLFLTKGAVSEDGSHVFFTDAETGRIYMREPQADPARTIAVSPGRAVWRATTADGSQVIYSEGEGADANLYRFTVEGERREALTSGAAGVLGVMGIGGDGAYVYFAAEGVLAPGAVPGAGNLYVYHKGQISFIADETRSTIAEEISQEQNSGSREHETTEAVWTAGDVGGVYQGGVAEGQKSASVSADGRTLMFTSPASLTGYDNVGHVEIYLYGASSGLTCVSCNPSGRSASADVVLYRRTNGIFFLPPELSPASQPRFLSEDGSRVFFESEEALVPGDINGRLNVYEWEREGAGSCPAGRGEGCLYLISSGTSTEPSFFAGASASGNDVFFFTGQPLVGQDTDELVDLYDARVDGGLAAQNPSAPVAPCQGEACRPAQTPVPALGVPVSQVFSGPGNLSPPPATTAPRTTTKKTTVKCVKGKKRSHGKCVKSKKSKKAKKAAKHGKKRS